VLFKRGSFELFEVHGLGFDAKCRFGCTEELVAVYRTDTASHKSTLESALHELTS
jgi:hypothetical protein